jgi:hypothetical protein
LRREKNPNKSLNKEEEKEMEGEDISTHRGEEKIR